MDRYSLFTCGNGPPVIMKEDDGKHSPVNDSEWRTKIRHYPYLTDEAKVKLQQKELKDAKIVCKAHASPFLPNARKKLVAKRVSSVPQQQDYRTGLMALLGLATLFPDRAIGYMLVSAGAIL